MCRFLQTMTGTVRQILRCGGLTAAVGTSSTVPPERSATSRGACPATCRSHRSTTAVDLNSIKAAFAGIIV